MFLSLIGVNLAGEYWIDDFRLAPALPDDPQPYLINAERVLYLDCQLDAVDQNESIALAQEFTRTQSARLMFLLDHPLVVPDMTMRWVLPPLTVGDEMPDSVRWQTRFYTKTAPPNRMPAKGEFCHAATFHGSLRDRFRLRAAQLATLPSETRRIYRALKGDEPFKKCVDDFVRLYALGLLVRKYSISASLAYHVASIDAVCKALGSWSGPSDFIRQHVAPTPNLDELLDALWGKIRSGHFHAGQAPLDDLGYVAFHPFFTADYVVKSQLADMGFWVTRQALVGWLLKEIDKRVTSSDVTPEA